MKPFKKFQALVRIIQREDQTLQVVFNNLEFYAVGNLKQLRSQVYMPVVETICG